jgi:hypothetical protein
MFNLLPDSLKKEIKAEYKLRVIIVILVFVLFIQLSFLVFIFPSWLISLYKEKETVAQAEEMSKSERVSNINSLTSIVTDTNTKLNMLNNTLEYPEFLPLANSILAQKTSSIKLDQFYYTSQSPVTGTISLNGVSATRDSLVAFVKSLQETKLFKSVDLPVSNLTKDKNIKFSLTLTISQ